MSRPRPAMKFRGKRDDSLCEELNDKLRKYCKSTSIHGLKYTVADECNWCERVVWILLFLSGVCFSMYFCYLMWCKWDESPVLVSLETNHYPLKEVPFPAVTVCNVNKVSSSRLREIHEELVATDIRFKNITYDQIRKSMRYMHKRVRLSKYETDELMKLDKTYKLNNISSLDLFHILKEITPAAEINSPIRMIENCTWQGGQRCGNNLFFLPTDEGICATFNYGANYSDPLLGFNVTMKKGPLHTGGNGYLSGLTLTLDANIADYGTTSGRYYGFKVLIHSPEEFPDVEDRGFVIGPGVEAYAGMKVTITSSSKDMAKKVPLSKRWCRTQEENHLKYYSNYSRSACIAECTAELMIQKCNCRPYFLRADPDVKLCDLGSYDCVSTVYDDIRQEEDTHCSLCMPSCTDIRYEPEISYAMFAGPQFNQSYLLKNIAKKLKLDLTTDFETVKRYIKTNLAVLHVYYKERIGTHYSTGIRYGMEDFISAVGGLMGMGVGMSFLSVIEFFYFLCLRKYLHLRYTRKREKRQKDIEKQQPVSVNQELDLQGSNST